MAVTEQERAQAEKRAQAHRQAGYAVAARYGRRSSRVVVKLNTDVQISFPPRLAEKTGRHRNQPLGTGPSLAEARCGPIRARPPGRPARFQALDGRSTRRSRRQRAQPRQVRQLPREWPQRRSAAQGGQWIRSSWRLTIILSTTAGEDHLVVLKGYEWAARCVNARPDPAFF